MQNNPGEEAATDFETFFAATEPSLRRALVAGFGGECGRDATAEALAYGWREWGRVSELQNPAGYLYRVGERWAKRSQRRLRPIVPPAVSAEVRFEPDLAPALQDLTLRQRQAVVLVVGFGFSHSEAAELLGISRSSIQNHVERAMSKLRVYLGAT
jgi:RNA polymerase sigma-70 factor (ECF subfamily)